MEESQRTRHVSMPISIDPPSSSSSSDSSASLLSTEPRGVVEPTVTTPDKCGMPAHTQRSKAQHRQMSASKQLAKNTQNHAHNRQEWGGGG